MALLSILISHFGKASVGSEAQLSPKTRYAAYSRKPCLNLLMLFLFSSLRRSLPFSLSVYMSYSPSSFSMPLALQAVVCFLALMFFYEQNSRIKAMEKKEKWWLKHKACTVLWMCAAWLRVVAWLTNVCMFSCVWKSVVACAWMRVQALNLLGSRCSDYRMAVQLNDRKYWSVSSWDWDTWMKFLSFNSWVLILSSKFFCPSKVK